MDAHLIFFFSSIFVSSMLYTTHKTKEEDKKVKTLVVGSRSEHFENILFSNFLLLLLLFRRDIYNGTDC